MRLVILSQYYPPEVGAPQGRLSDLAERLQRKGHDVTVVTAMPHYPTLEVVEPWRGKLWGEEEINGVRVLRSWIYVPKIRSTWRQLANYGSFVASSLLSGALRLRRADVLMWESPPLFLAPTAAALAQRLHAKLAMNVSDLWPRSAVDFGLVRRGHTLQAFEALECWAYKSADLIMGQTLHILEGVRSTYPSASTVLYPNGVDTEFFRRRTEDRRSINALSDLVGAFVVGYVGTFGRSHGLEQVVRAADLLRDTDLAFVLVGDGPRKEAIVTEARRLELPNIRFLPPLSRSEVPAFLSSTDVNLVCVADWSVSRGARPSKMFEVLSTETPMIYCGRGEGAGIARASGAALVIDPEAPEQLARAIREMMAISQERRMQMGSAGRLYVQQNFDRATIADQVESALLDLIGHVSLQRHHHAGIPDQHASVEDDV